MKKLFLTSVLLGVMGLVAGPVSAQEKKEPPKTAEPKKDAPKTGTAPTMSPEEQAAMEAMMKNATPGEHHKALSALAGKWNLALKYRMAPDAPWQEETATADITKMWEGRFINQKVKGQAMEIPGMPPGPPFEGFGILGYDNGTKKHTSFWMDNMGTQTMHAEGTCSANCKEITVDGPFLDCTTGKPSHMKSIYKIEGNDKFVLSMFTPGPDGKDFLNMEITYTRAK